MPPSLLNQAVSYQNPTGADMHNQQGLGLTTVTKARVEQGYKTIASATGEQQQIALTIFFKASETVAVNSKVIYNGNAYRVLVVAKIAGRNGAIDHLEAMAEVWNI